MKKSLIINNKIRLFPTFVNDIKAIGSYSLELGYTLTFLIEKLNKKKTEIFVSTLYPYKNYLENLYEFINNYKEKVFIFYLDNYLHSDLYLINFVDKVLDNINNFGSKKYIIIQSNKINQEDAIRLLKKYKYLKIIIKGDLEYFLNELCLNNKSIDNINNIFYKNNKGKVIFNKNNDKIDVSQYLLSAYNNGYLENYQNDLAKKMVIKTNNNERLKDLLNNSFFTLLTGKGCIYGCNYCSRGYFNKISIINIENIKKDLDYISKNTNIKRIMVLDSCFVTINYKRFKEIIDLFNLYNFEYDVCIRYEIINENIMNLIIKSNISRIQFGLQTINEKPSKIIGRHFHKENFIKTINTLKKNGKKILIDTILGLPGDNLKGFLKTINFAINLNPNFLSINTLFLNPSTKLFQDKDKYGLNFEDKTNNKLINYICVPKISHSDSFSIEDIEKAKKYSLKIQKYYEKKIIVFIR